MRNFISPYKDTADEWLDCMRVGNQVGLYTTATMMYGSVDTFDDRVEHLIRLRDGVAQVIRLNVEIGQLFEDQACAWIQLERLLIFAGLILVLTQYKDVVHAAFFATFVITVGVFAAAIAVRDTTEKN